MKDRFSVSYAVVENQVTDVHVLENGNGIRVEVANPLAGPGNWSVGYVHRDGDTDSFGFLADGKAAKSIAYIAETITTTVGANGSISPSGVVPVASGVSMDFSITPNTR